MHGLLEETSQAAAQLSRFHEKEKEIFKTVAICNMTYSTWEKLTNVKKSCCSLETTQMI